MQVLIWKILPRVRASKESSVKQMRKSIPLMFVRSFSVQARSTTICSLKERSLVRRISQSLEWSNFHPSPSHRSLNNLTSTRTLRSLGRKKNTKTLAHGPSLSHALDLLLRAFHTSHAKFHTPAAISVPRLLQVTALSMLMNSRHFLLKQ